MEWKTGRHNRQDLKKEHSQHFFMITDNRLIVLNFMLSALNQVYLERKNWNNWIAVITLKNLK